jgi:hypothetical protein
MRRTHWVTGLVGAVIVAGSAALVPATATTAAVPAPANQGDPALGNGLGRLVAESERPSFKARSASGIRLDQEALTTRDAEGRVLIQLTPQAGTDAASFRKQAEGLGLVVKNVDRDHGTLVGFTPLSAVRGLAALPETGTIAQVARPTTRTGSALSQGVALERADRAQAKGADGKGITIGVLSDSYNTAETTLLGDPLKIHAAQDVKSGDLPGHGNPQNSQPVVVIQDLPAADGGFDEGRALLQIAHDVAPAAKLCFATAFIDQVGFAENIRKLADKQGPCGADVIVDDIGYFDESMFGDSIIADAINDVAAKGVQYFSSAGNNGEQQSWNSPIRLVPAKTGLQGTNLDFSNVDPALYDGGLQDLNPGSGTDVAQEMTVGEGGGQLDLQWDDPVDLDGAKLGSPIFQATGAITKSKPQPSFTFTPTAAQMGKQVVFTTDAIPSGTTDLILSVDAPDGTNLGEVDTGTSPESLAVTLNQAGKYKITVSGFDGDTGDFTLDARPVLSQSKVTTDFNALLFDEDGNFLFSVADTNRLTGRPFELGAFDGPGKMQLVIARAGTGPMGATRLRNVLDGDVAFTEYSDPLSPAFYGHPTAKGATAVGAYDPFRPFLPEFFTTQGGDLPIMFDSAGNRYNTTQVRRVPQVSGADGGNTTFFGVDNARDADAQPNFFGTSASAPHVAAIAALALQKAGGPRSITPTNMRTRLEQSVFKHDLDPMRSGGTAGGLTITAAGPQGYEQDVVPGPMNDPKFFTLKYDGNVPLKSVTFYGETASPTALGKRNPPDSDGIVFDPRHFDGVTPFRTDGSPFRIGSTTGGLPWQQVVASFSVPGGGQSVAGQYRHMTLTFTSSLKKGQGLQFGVDRDLAISGFGGSNEGNGADELGGATFLPSGLAVPAGMKFVAERTDGTKISGAMSNRLGYGFSPIDGYGLVNAEQAVLGH